MASARHFSWHLAEMFLAMLIAMAGLDAVFDMAAPTLTRGRG